MLVDVVNFVAADFLESGCPARVFLGKEFLAENQDANRVVFVPSSDPHYVNSVSSVSREQITSLNFARALMARMAGCEVHIWGAAAPIPGTDQVRADYQVLNALINQTALSLYRSSGLGHMCEFLGGSHLNDRGVHERRGFVYVMRIAVQVPIVDIDFPVGAIDTSVFTWLLQNDVSALTTVETVAAVPTGTVMSSMQFTVAGET